MNMKTACIALFLSVTSAAMGQNCSWTFQPDTPLTPRVNSQMAYDAAHGYVIVQGGFESGGSFLSETWTWDGASWNHLGNNGPVTANGSAAYDEAREQVVLFTGYPSGGLTYTWNGSSWTRVASSGPSPREAPSMAYDAARQEIILFGGSWFGVKNNETWVWNGSTWRLASTNGPSPRHTSTMAFDPMHGEILLFGGLVDTGTGGQTEDGETWAWNGTSWTLRATQGPSPRLSSHMWYSQEQNGILLYGGFGNGGTNYQDLWKWDGTAWEQLSLSGDLPSGAEGDVALDTSRNVLVLFAPNNFSGELTNETWEFSCLTPCNADLTGDGVVDTLDFLLYLVV